MLGEMLQYKNYHDDPTKPPFPWDPEAARWSREYRKKHPNIFPVDTRELMRPERVKLNESAATATKRPGIRLAPDAKAAKASVDAPTQRSVRPSAAVMSRPPAHDVSVRIKPGNGSGAAPSKSGHPIVKPRPKVRIK
jgi:hypothetical protein